MRGYRPLGWKNTAWLWRQVCAPGFYEAPGQRRYEQWIQAANGYSTTSKVVAVSEVCHLFGSPLSLSDGVAAAWAPFFDDGELFLLRASNVFDDNASVNAMIFLCPMSNFDVPLKEDPSVDSLVRA